MGQVVGPSKLVAARTVSIGDLVVYSYGDGSRTGLVAQLNDHREPLVAVLAGGELPYIERLNDDTECANLGSDWILEPTSRPSGPEMVDIQRRAGLLVLTAGGWVMNFATSGVDRFGRFSWEWRRLPDLELVQRVGRGAVHAGWRLWREAGERGRIGSNPTIEFEAKPIVVGQ